MRRLILIIVSLVLSFVATRAEEPAFKLGDVLVGVSGGKVQHRDPDGVLIRTLDTAQGGYTTGMAFDTLGNLYVTNFDAGNVRQFSATGGLLGTFGTSYSGFPESIVFDATGNAYVGAVEGDNDIRRFDATGKLVGQFNVAIDDRGSDWIDLASDQKTMFYTSEGRRILRYDVSTGTQLTDFKTLPGSGVAYALRLLAPGDGSGGLLVADSVNVKRLNGSGSVVATYDAPGEDCWFALNLDPDGTSFWSANYCTSNVYKFDIATATQLASFNTNTPDNTVFGLVVSKEVTSSLSLDLLDPVSELLDGPHLVSPDNPSGLATLATKGRRRDGVAAEGVARLVLRFNAPSAGEVSFSLVDENGAPLSSEEETGTLQDLSATQSANVTVGTQSTNAGHKAFALYIAPSRFVREGQSGDLNVQQRQVFIKATFAPSVGEPIATPLVPVAIVRPLVFLVHGIWSEPSAWNNFKPLVQSTAAFDIRRADYPPDGHFSTGAVSVYNQLKEQLRLYKDRHKVAAIQADLVGHSMAGPVTRTMGFLSQYLFDSTFPTFGAGPVHRFITVGGVHDGTPMANILLEKCTVDRNRDGIPDLHVYFEKQDKSVDEGAVADLERGSAANALINSQSSPFGIHTIVGLASEDQKGGNNAGFLQIIDGLFCDGNVFNGYDSVLTSENDLLVPGFSQRGNRPTTSPTISSVSGVVHSPPFQGLVELGSTVAGKRATELLNSTQDDDFGRLPDEN